MFIISIFLKSIFFNSCSSNNLSNIVLANFLSKIEFSNRKGCGLGVMDEKCRIHSWQKGEFFA